MSGNEETYEEFYDDKWKTFAVTPLVWKHDEEWPSYVWYSFLVLYLNSILSKSLISDLFNN